MANAQLLRRGRLQSTVAFQSGPAVNDPLAITDIKAWPLREPVSGRRYTVVRLTARNGSKGYGECLETTAADVDTGKKVIAGMAASAYEIAWLRLASLPRLRAAINVAMLDILGRYANAPLYQVLGGPTRNKCRALAPIEGAGGLERAQSAGHRAFSVPLPDPEWRNAGKAYVQKVAGLMNMVRRAAGESADFVLDGGGKLVPGDAQSIAAELERFHLLFFDEPCPTTTLGAARKIADENVAPLGFGRWLSAPPEFQNLLRDECVDVLRPDLALHGISSIRRIAVQAEVSYVAVAPYHNGGPISTAAALHLAASLPNFVIQQVPLPADQRDRDMRATIAGAELEKVTQGFAQLPTGPGLGITVNESALEKYAA